MEKITTIDSLIGKTILSIEQTKTRWHDNEMLVFYINDKEYIRMYHDQDCCESVCLEDIVGDLNDLLGTPIISAEEITYSTSEKTYPPDYTPEEDENSTTWTFYTIRTVKGTVTLRWLGESNGYYSERVDVEYVMEEEETKLPAGR